MSRATRVVALFVIVSACVGLVLLSRRTALSDHRLVPTTFSHSATPSSERVYAQHAHPVAQPGTPGARFTAEVGARNAAREAAARASRFDAWLLNWRRADAAGQAELAFHGVQLAADRRDALAYLIQTDPKLALSLAVPPGVVPELPTDVQALLERRIDERGNYVVEVQCGAPTPVAASSEINRYAQIGNERLQAFVFGRREGEGSKHDIPLHGIAVDNVLALDELPFRELETSEPGYKKTVGTTAVKVGNAIVMLPDRSALATLQANLLAAEAMLGPDVPSTGAPGASHAPVPATPAGWTTGNKRVLFIRVDFSDAPGSPISDADLTANVAVASTFYQDVSQGQASLTPTILPAIFRMPQTKAAYEASDDTEIQTEALKQARAYDAANGNTGLYNPDQADRWVICYTRMTSSFFVFAGIANVGDKGVRLNGTDGFKASTIAHELGHNNGLYHAHAWDVSSGDPTSPSGVHDEYGDPYDTMARADLAGGHFNVFEKHLLGFLPDAAVTQVSQSGTYRLFRHDHRSASGVRALRVAFPNSGPYEYWAEYRIDPPSTGAPNLSNRVLLHWGAPGPFYATGPGTYLIDTTTATPAEFDDAGVAIGTTYTDSEAGLSFTPTAVGGTSPNEYIDVRIDYGAVAPNHNPTVASTPVASADARTTLSFSAAGADPDGDSIHYRWDFGDSAINPATASVQHRYIKGGNYTVTVTSLDGKGGRSTPVTYPITVNEPYATWTKRSQNLPNAVSYQSVVYGGGQFVTVGSLGSIAHSPDGVAWVTASQPYGASLLGRGIACSGSRYVAVGWLTDVNLGGIVYSDDAVTWQTASFPANAPQLRAVTYANGRFVAVGDAGKIYQSTNGQSWTESATGITDIMYAVAYSSGLFVAVGDNGRILTSNDGVTWANHSISKPHLLTCVSTWATGWVATEGTYVWGSTDGFTWTQLPDRTPSPATYFMFTNHSGTVLMPSAGALLQMAEPDRRWEHVSIADASTNEFFGLAEGNGLLVAVGANGGIYTAGTPTLAAAALTLSDGYEAQVGRVNSLATTSGGFVKLELLVDGNKVAENNGSGSLDWTPTRFGTYDVAVRGTTSSGATQTSPATSVRAIFSDWQAAVPQPIAAGLLDVTRANGHWIVAGRAGALYQVDDGGLAQRIDLHTAQPFYGVAYGNGQYLALGYTYDLARNGTGSPIWTSNDGINWLATGDESWFTMNHAVYAANQWVAVGVQAKIVTSTNGYSWVLRNSVAQPNQDLQRIAYAAGRWVAVGQAGHILTSTDAVTWTAATSNSTADLYGVTYGNARWVAVGNGGEVLTSTDGVLWTHRTSGAVTQLRAVAYVRNNFVAVGLSGTVLLSPDGATWTAGKIGGRQSNLNAIGVDGDNSILVGDVGEMLVSTNLADTWVRRTNGVDNDRRAVAYGGGRFVSVGASGDSVAAPALPANQVSISSDGLVWTSVSLPGPGSPIGYGIVWAGSQFIAVGAFGGIYTSPDGSTWTARTSGTTNDLYAIAYRSGVAVAVGRGGTVLTSADGVTWAPHTSGSSAGLNAITAGTNGFAAVGDFGALVTSSDGTSWTARSSGVAVNLTAIAAVDGIGYVAGGFNGTILTSSDGSTWVQRDAGLRDQVGAIVNTSQGALISFGYNGGVAGSGDGVNWTRAAMPGDRMVRGFAVSGDNVVAVGDGGLAVAQSLVTLPAPVPSDAGRIINMSIMTNTGLDGDTLIVGVSVGGTTGGGTKPLLIRGVGPSLGIFGVGGAVADPIMTLYRGTTAIDSNDDWIGGYNFSTLGAFGYSGTPAKDSALYYSALPAGAYSIQVVGKARTTGIALAEIYDATPSALYTTTTPRLINVSARAQVSSGSGVLTAGFVVGGSSSVRVLIRAAGPTLSSFGVAGALADPTLAVYSGQTKIAENNDWGGTAELKDAFNAVSAFGYASDNSKDAALVIRLQPGSYSAQVNGAGGSSGVALIEVYEVP